jgi:hypothetical protein
MRKWLPVIPLTEVFAASVANGNHASGKDVRKTLPPFWRNSPWIGRIRAVTNSRFHVYF